MGTILVVENDPVFSAVLEDRLHVAGHDVKLLRERGRAIAAAVETPMDLLIFEIAQPGNDGLDMVSALRERPETRALPILVLSKSIESADRVAALRAGADDYLTKPCDFEELMLRTERLLGARSSQQPVLQGDLANHPLWELVQFLQQAGQSGALVLRSPAGNGRVRLNKGKLMMARWEELPPKEALLAVFGLKQGTFRFVAEPSSEMGDEPLPTHEILMEAAWLEDELEKRRELLPVTGAPLSLTGKPVPSGGNLEISALPLEEIRSAIERRSQETRLFDLLQIMPWAPQKLRLSVACMAEHDVLTVPQSVAHAYPTTSEITSTQLTEMAITELLSAARTAGFGTSALPFLILFESGHGQAMLEILENVPGFARNKALRDLREQVKLNHAGCASFSVELGKAVLHVKALDPGAQDDILATLTVSAGVYLWLDKGAEPELTERAVRAFEALDTPTQGVVVASGGEAAELVERLTAGTKHWRISSNAPKSLLGVFRLLQPGPL